MHSEVVVWSPIGRDKFVIKPLDGVLRIQIPSNSNRSGIFSLHAHGYKHRGSLSAKKNNICYEFRRISGGWQYKMNCNVEMANMWGKSVVGFGWSWQIGSEQAGRKNSRMIGLHELRLLHRLVRTFERINDVCCSWIFFYFWSDIRNPLVLSM